MNYTLTIDAEFQSLIPPLLPEERAGLEALILSEGCRDAIVVWRQDDQEIIVDGHNRYDICQAYQLPFETVAKEFESREEVKAWMEETQLGKRNLSPDWHTYFLGCKYEREKQAHGGDRIASGQNDQMLTTAEDLGDKHGVVERTVRRAAAYSKAVDALIETLGTPYRTKILSGFLKLTRKDVIALAEMPPARQRKLISRIETKASKGIFATLKGEMLIEMQEENDRQKRESKENKPRVFLSSAVDWLQSQPDCDLLITDPPYSTDVDDIELFAATWLPVALAKVKSTGRAYVCIGAYPEEIAAYLHAATLGNHGLHCEQILVWTYRNTLGPAPRFDYKLNWQAILYFRGADAPELNCPVMTEQFSVQDLNAPDGRLGDRYHAWQKPSELAERLIRHSTQPGDLVLDCFAGTGTFVLAAASLGRVAFGCDQSPEMLNLAAQRGCLYAK